MVLALVGCDRVFGLGDIAASAAPDAPPPEVASCPEPGAGPPVFGTSIEELVPRACYYFTYSQTTGLGYATCGNEMVEGPLGGPLEVSAIAPNLPGAYLDRPGVAPEGTRMLVRQLSTPTQRISWYARTGATWTWLSDLMEDTALTTPGVPSAGPDRRALIATTTGYHEFVESNDTWTELRVSPWATMGVTGGAQLHLSPDGLRLTFILSSMVMYAERPDLAAEFGTASQVASVGSTPSAFITEDCARVYYSVGDALVFRRQI